MLDIQVNTAQFVKGLGTVAEQQLPFATSRALNACAIEMQAAIRTGMKARMTIRRPWVLLGIKIKPFATKQSLSVTLSLDPKRAFLAKFEEGGIKRPTGKTLAVPREAPRTAAGIVQRAYRPKALRFTQGADPRVAEGMKRTLLLRSASGTGGVILQRKGRAKRTVLKLLYLLIPKATIKPILQFQVTAKRVADARIGPLMERELVAAIKTAK